MNEPIIVAWRSKAANVFALSNSGFVVWNRTRGSDVCARFICVFRCRAITVQGILPTAYKFHSSRFILMGNRSTGLTECKIVTVLN
jgi:hypothetical protein